MVMMMMIIIIITPTTTTIIIIIVRSKFQSFQLKTQNIQGSKYIFEHIL